MIAPNGTVKRVLRFAVLGTSSEISGKKEARNILQAKLRPINQGRQRPQSTMTLGQFVTELWQPAVIPTLRSGSSRYYGVQLRCHILPAFGSRRLCDITRIDIQTFLADKRKSGFSGSSAHGMRTAISKVLQAAVDWNLLEQNAARGIRIGDRAPKTEKPYLNPKQVCQLLVSLPEPCRALVLVAVLTGMRIGEILALRWKALDLARGVIQVRETVSEGKFGSPKTKSSRRDIPISQPVCDAFQTQLAGCRQCGPEDLVFTTRKQTSLNPKNLLRRVLRPTCKALGLPLISWHSFRHTHATQLAEVGESLRTAQSLLGHSKLETTLNVYTHAIPDAQRRAVDKVAEVLFTNFRNISSATEDQKVK
ncbi:MAG TPA: site-specific integrase [Candidatus Acidoferrum sp.]|nr:site-specific integrase [Candidatus Acidoferrum sp.]